MTKSEFKEYFDTYFDPIRNYVFYKCGDIDLASDIAQEVFLRLWEKRYRLDNRALKSLLYKMASDLFISHYRHLNVESGFVQNSMITDEDKLQPADCLMYKELKLKYASALMRMPEGQREVFLMHREEELKYHEIAIRLNISVKTVEKRISAALQFLRTELDELI